MPKRSPKPAPKRANICSRDRFSKPRTAICKSNIAFTTQSPKPNWAATNCAPRARKFATSCTNISRTGFTKPSPAKRAFSTPKSRMSSKIGKIGSSCKFPITTAMTRKRCFKTTNRLSRRLGRPTATNCFMFLSKKGGRSSIRQSLLTGRREVVAGLFGQQFGARVVARSPHRRRRFVQRRRHANFSGRHRRRHGAPLAAFRRHRHRARIFRPTASALFSLRTNRDRRSYTKSPVDGGRARRLSFGYTYNASPQYASDGKSAFFLARTDAGFNVAWIDIETQRIEPLTAIGLADSPSPSPNDEMVIFRDERQPRYLFTTSINGKVSLRWRKLAAGEIKDPAWGPLTSDWY